MAKKIISGKHELIKQDLVKWAKNASIFAAPALLVFLTSIQAGQPVKEALGVVYLWIINTIIDLLRKYIAQNTY